MIDTRGLVLHVGEIQSLNSRNFTLTTIMGKVSNPLLSSSRRCTPRDHFRVVVAVTRVPEVPKEEQSVHLPSSVQSLTMEGRFLPPPGTVHESCIDNYSPFLCSRTWSQLESYMQVS